MKKRKNLITEREKENCVHLLKLLRMMDERPQTRLFSVGAFLLLQRAGRKTARMSSA